MAIIRTATAAARLDYLLEIIPGKLNAIPEADFSAPFAAGQWSRKQILGHLADSACNNHQRFIRAQYEAVPLITYDPDHWTYLNHYDKADCGQLIGFWTSYNRHLAHLIRQIPPENLSLTCNTGGTEPVTLLWLINDYVAHMEHHLHQITDY